MHYVIVGVCLGRLGGWACPVCILYLNEIIKITFRKGEPQMFAVVCVCASLCFRFSRMFPFLLLLFFGAESSFA